MKCRRHGILGVPRHVRPEPSFAFLSGPTVRGDRFAQARRYGDDSHRAEQMLMQLAQFPGDDVVPARQFRAQPQRPVPEMIVNAGQRGRIHLPRRCGLVRAAEQQVHLCRAGHDQHVAPGAAEPVPLRDDRVQGLTMPGSAMRTSSNAATVTAKSQSDQGAAWPLARDPASSTLEILASEDSTAITLSGSITDLAETSTKR